MLAALAADVSPRILCHAGVASTSSPAELDDYFAGRRHTFDVAVDLQLAHGFRRAVLVHLREIPFGATASYAAVAGAAGSPNAVRAVGTACANNPVPLVVPCHRVVRSDGTQRPVPRRRRGQAHPAHARAAAAEYGGAAPTERAPARRAAMGCGRSPQSDRRSRPDRACASTPGGDGVWGRSPRHAIVRCSRRSRRRPSVRQHAGR